MYTPNETHAALGQEETIHTMPGNEEDKLEDERSKKITKC